MQKKNKPIPKSQLIIRVISIVLFSNICLLLILNQHSTPASCEKEFSQKNDNSYFKIKAKLKTKFENNKEILVRDSNGVQVKAILISFNENEDETDESKHFIVQANNEDIAKLYSMKAPEILPSNVNLSLKNKKQIKRRNYEISY